MQHVGGAIAASDDVHNRGRKLEEIRWEKEMVRNSWAEKEESVKFQEQGKKKS